LINTQNNNINAGSGTVLMSFINSLTGIISATSINTQSGSLTLGTGTITTIGNISSGQINTQSGSLTLGTGTITTTGAITSGSINTQSGSLILGSGTITTTGNVSFGQINTQNNNINVGSGTITISGNISSGQINTQSGALTLGTGTITTTGAISSGQINTQNGALTLGSGTITTTGAISSGQINTQSGALTLGSGTITTTGAISSGQINTQSGALTLGSGTITTTGTISSGQINTQSGALTLGSGTISTIGTISSGQINTQNNNINIGSGSITSSNITASSGTINTLSTFQSSGIVSSTSLSTIVGGLKLIDSSATCNLPIQTHSGTLPNFLVTGGSYFYFNDSTVATQLGSTAGSISSFGNAVAFSADGNTALVGAYNANSGTGYAAIYRYTNGTWTTATTLTSTAGAGANFGYAVALSANGNTALVGAYNGNSGNGYAAIYRYTGGTWSTATELVSTAGSSASFGKAVALSADGNTAAVGAPLASPSNNGYVAIYRYTSGSWSSATTLVSTAGTGGSFGKAVALSADGNTAAVGANTSGSVGYAAIYRYTGGTWSSATALTSTSGTGAQFGYAIALSADGNTALVGAYTANPSNSGYAEIYRYTNGTWSSAILLTSTAGTLAQFGYALALSADGNTALVGAPSTNSGNGYAAVYRYTSSTWSAATSLVSTAGSSSFFGSAVALSADGNTALIGAYNANSVTGYAAVYTIGSKFQVNNTLAVYNNYVGIGTTAPQSNLHVVGNAIIAGQINTQSGSLILGTGTITTTGNISSGQINTQSGSLTLGTGTITTTGNISSGQINTQSGSLTLGTGTITTTGNISSGKINTQNNTINAGSGTISASNINILQGGSISYNGVQFIDSNQNITVASITTQNNSVNVGSGIIYTNTIAPQSLINNCNISFSGANLTNVGLYSVGQLQTQSITTLTNSLSFNNANLLNVNTLNVSNINILTNGLNTITNLPTNVVTLNLQTGTILDSIISSNIARIMQSGQYAGTINPAQLPIVPSNRSTLLRTSDSVGIGTRSAAQKLHVNAGNMCVTGGRIGIGTTQPFTSMHIYDNNASAGAVFYMQALGSTDYMNIVGLCNYNIFKVAASCNIGIQNGSPLYTLDVNGIINSTSNRTTALTSGSGTIDCTQITLSNIGTAYIKNLIVSSNFTVPNTITANSFITYSNLQTNTITSAGNTNIVVYNALRITGFDQTLWPGSGQLVGNMNSTYQSYIGLKVDYAVYANNLITPSDRRIKDNIKRLSSYSNLESILRLTPRSYTLRAVPDALPTQGFIAQELEPVLPHAVYTIRNVIPSIMQYVERIPWKQSSVYLKNHGLKQTDTVKAFLNDILIDLHILSIETSVITFKEPIPENVKIYLYGIYVDDFKVIEHEKLLPVICGAVQELHKLIATQQSQIDSILTRLDNLEH